MLSEDEQKRLVKVEDMLKVIYYELMGSELGEEGGILRRQRRMETRQDEADKRITKIETKLIKAFVIAVALAIGIGIGIGYLSFRDVMPFVK